MGITPLLYDVASLQKISGKNMAWARNDSIYHFEFTLDNNVGFSALQPFQIFKNQRKVIWDAGGVDTFDASTYTASSNLSISLLPGTLSSIGGTRNIGIADGATIENAKGGDGNDTIIGNDVNNVLTGNKGDDVLQGGKGNDTLDGGEGDDSLEGGVGDDLLIGGGGTDTIIGGAGNDTLDGGTGTSKFVFAPASGTAGKETIKNGSAGSTVWVGAIQLKSAGASGIPLSTTAANTWTDGAIQYNFIRDASNPLSPIGTLKITGGALGAGEISIESFNLQSAQSTTGYLGIQLAKGVGVAANIPGNSFLSNGYAPADGTVSTTGREQSVTFYLSTPALFDTALSIAAIGGTSPSLSLSSGLLSLSGGAATIIIPAGADSVTVGLVNGGDLSAAQSIKLSAIISGTSLASNSVTVNYAAVAPAIPGTAIAGVNGTLPVAGSFTAAIAPVTFYKLDGGNDKIIAGTGTNIIAAAIVGYKLVDGSFNIANSAAGGTFPTGLAGAIQNYAAGNNTIVGGGGQNLIGVGNGNNQIYARSVVSLDIALSQQASASARHAVGDWIVAGDGNNTVIGGTGDDLILVGQGSNIIVCGPGQNTVYNGVIGSGNTYEYLKNVLPGDIQGSDDQNNHQGFARGNLNQGGRINTGNATIYGGTGNSGYELSNGNNYLVAGVGNDTIVAGRGNNTIFGGGGNDTIWGGGGNNYIHVGAGDSLVVGQGGNVTVIGGSGNDTMWSGDSNASWATSQTGNSSLRAGTGNTRMSGAGGHDTLIGGSGRDTIFAGDGTEYIQAGSGDTGIMGGAGINLIVLGSGRDSVSAGSGATTIVGGSGVDLIFGGSGNNVLSAGDGGTETDPTQVSAGTGNTTIRGGAGINLLFGGAGTNVIYAGDGGNILRPTQVVAGSGATTIYGGLGIANLVGGAGDDVIYAGDGGIYGHATWLTGGSGNSTLVSGNGTAAFVGGTGQTTYLIKSGTNSIVTSSARDILQLDANIADVQASRVDYTDGSVVKITLNNGATLTINDGGVSQAQFADGSVATFDQLLAPTFRVGDATYSSVNSELNWVAGVFNGFAARTAGEAQAAVLPITMSLTLTGDDDIRAIGNNVDNVLRANGGNDTLVAGTANNTLVGGGVSAEYDVIAGTGTVTKIQGSTYNDKIVFVAGTRFGDLSATTATGANGALVVTLQKNHGGQVIVEGNVSDNDSINGMLDEIAFDDGSTATLGLMLAALTSGPTAGTSAISVVLANGIQNMTLVGAANIAATGNAQNNVITANNGNDTLIAGTGNATLVGGGGTATYVVGLGNVTIKNSGSADTLVFGAEILERNLTATSAVVNGSTVVTIGNSEAGAITIDGGGLSQLRFANGDVATVSQLLAASYTLGTTTYSKVNATAGAGVTTLHLTGSANLIGTANGLSNVITANSGNDTLIAGTGNDTLVGGSGSNTYVVRSDAQVTTIMESSFLDKLRFGSGVTLANLSASAAKANDGSSNVTIVNSMGGTVVVNSAGYSLDRLVFADNSTASLGALLAQATSGSTAATSALDVVMGEGTQHMTLTGTGNLTARGNSLDGVISANSGNDTLIAGRGNDTLIGGSGATTFVVNWWAGDVSINQSGNGDTLVYGAEILERDLLASSAVVNGNTVVTISNGPAATVTINGGALRQVHFANGDAVTLSQLLASGYTVGTTSYSKVDAIAGADITTLSLTGSANITGTATNLNTVIRANSGNDTLIAGTGNDTLIGGVGINTYVVSNVSRTTTINDSGAADTLSFGPGVKLAGLIANAEMTGNGSINIRVGSFSSYINVVINTFGNPLDKILFADGSTASLGALLAQATSGPTSATSAVDVILGRGIQNMTLTGTANLTATGNNLNDVITSNQGNDTLIAGTGNDTLVGGNGGATTYGVNLGSGVVTVASSTSADTLQFGPGISAANLSAKTAVVANVTVVTIAVSGGKSVVVKGGALNQIRFADGATTTVSELVRLGDIQSSAINATLAGGLHQLILTGAGNISGTANDLDDVIIANSGNDTLYAGSGNDTLYAGTGNSTLVSGSGHVTMVSGNPTGSGSGATTFVDNGQFAVASQDYNPRTQQITIIGGPKDILQLAPNMVMTEFSVQRNGDNWILQYTSLNYGFYISSQVNVNGPLGFLGLPDGTVIPFLDFVNGTYVDAGIQYTSVSTTVKPGITNIVLTGSNNIAVTGNDLDDVITTSYNRSTWIAEATGVDTLIGGSGNDTLIGSKSTVLIGGSGATMFQGAGTVIQSSINDAIYIPDYIYTNWGQTYASAFMAKIRSGSQTPDVVLKADGSSNLYVTGDYYSRLLGIRLGAANKINQVRFSDGSSLSIDAILLNAPSFAISSATSIVMPGNAISLTLTGSANVTATANMWNDVITANSGNDTLIAGTGNATFYGNGGTVTYLFNTGSGQITIGNSAIADTLLFGAGITASNLVTYSNVVNGAASVTLAVSSGGSVSVNGGALSQVKFANGSTTTLGALVSAATASSAVSTVMGAGVTKLTLTGTASISATGNGLNDTIIANSGNDTLIAGTGNSRLIAGTGNDLLVAGSGNDTLTGGGGVATYQFNVGNGATTITNSLSVDTLQFGVGITAANLTVTPTIVDYQTVLTVKVSSGGSIVVNGALNQVRFADGSTTTLNALKPTSMTSSKSVVMGIGITKLTLTGTANITGTANELNDIIYANSGNDTLIAGSGKDTLVGSSGSTTYLINYGNGITTIENSNSTDTLQFANGFNYHADSVTARTTLVNGVKVVNLNIGDRNSIVINGGALSSLRFSDGTTATVASLAPATTMLSDVDAVLPAGMTVLKLLGSNSITGQANDVDSMIIANFGNDTLVAGRGNDTLVGGGGGTTTTYAVGTNSGVTTIDASRRYDTLQFGAGISLNNLAAIAAIGSDGSPTVTITDSLGKPVLVNGYDNSNGYGLDYLSFADNSTASLGTLLAQASTGITAATSAVNVILAPGIQHMQLTGTGNLTATGNDLSDVIIANSGNDSLISGTGNDTLIAGTGNDTLVGGSGVTTYQFNVGNGITTIKKSASADTLKFGVGITAGNLSASSAMVSGVTTVTISVSSGGSVVVNGGALSRIVFADGSATTLAALAASSTSMTSSVNAVMGPGITKLTLTGTGNISGTGNNLAHTIIANSGNDTLIAGTGLATLIGGAGNDVFVINNIGDVVTAQSGALSNTIQTSVSYTASANVNKLTGTGTAAITLTGNNLANVITANSGNDTLIAGTGLATLIGGAGNNTFIINKVGDVITKAVNSGNNTELTSVSATLAANVQNLTGTGTGALTLTGNNLTNVITANGSANRLVAGNGTATLVSGAGNDTLVGGTGTNTFVVNNAADVVTAQSAALSNTIQTSVSYTAAANVKKLTGTGSAPITLTGNSLANTITANSGDDTLIAGLGLATLIGGSGNNTFVINNASDVITKAVNSGNNTELTSVSATLAANVQNLTGTGTASLTLTGNNLTNVITANSSANRLVAGNGTATLVSGVGNDTLVGGTGTNTFVVNNTGDVVTAQSAAVSNKIQTSVSYTAAANVKTLIGTGTAAITLTGNSLVHTITANSGDDTLIAGTGLATLIGGSGNNTFVINHGSDVIIKAANNGNNTELTSVSATLPANVQNLTGTGTASLTLTGNNLTNVITANSSANRLVAGTGTTTLVSGAGFDTLAGGTGNNTFVVNSASDVVIAQATAVLNTIQSSVSYTASANVTNLILTGTGALTATGNSGNDLLVANSGASTLVGGTGTNVLQGGAGASTLKNPTGKAAFLGGAGSEVIMAGTGAAFIDGGAGNDNITLGAGAAVVAFNTGGGADTVTAGTGVTNVLSLGKGIAYANLTFKKSGTSLVLNTGGTDSVTFNNWYSGAANQNFVTLQVIEASAATFNASSSNPLYNQGVEAFDFKKLVAAFNTALAANPTMTSWNLMNSLLTNHLSGSNTAALGGDLAYYDGLNGNLAGLNLATATGTLQDATYGKTAQAVDAWSGVSTGGNRLR